MDYGVQFFKQIETGADLEKAEILKGNFSLLRLQSFKKFPWKFAVQCKFRTIRLFYIISTFTGYLCFLSIYAIDFFPFQSIENSFVSSIFYEITFVP